MFKLSNGEEQVKFDRSIPISRSDIILNNIKRYLNNSGTILDLGTGNGVFSQIIFETIQKMETIRSGYQ